MVGTNIGFKLLASGGLSPKFCLPQLRLRHLSSEHLMIFLNPTHLEKLRHGNLAKFTEGIVDLFCWLTSPTTGLTCLSLKDCYPSMSNPSGPCGMVSSRTPDCTEGLDTVKPNMRTLEMALPEERRCPRAPKLAASGREANNSRNHEPPAFARLPAPDGNLLAKLHSHARFFARGDPRPPSWSENSPGYCKYCITPPLASVCCLWRPAPSQPSSSLLLGRRQGENPSIETALNSLKAADPQR